MATQDDRNTAHECSATTLVIRRAVFSRCKNYRYSLERKWRDGTGHCVFIGLNPSRADQHSDDPTVRRCMGYARTWGFRRLTVVNLFAFRTPYPTELKPCGDPAGPANLRAIRRACAEADCIVAAWGAQGALFGQAHSLGHVWQNLTLQCFGVTTNGQPLHPLYQRRDAQLQLFQPALKCGE